MEVHADTVMRTGLMFDANGSFDERVVSINEEIRFEMTAEDTATPLSVFRARGSGSR